MTDIFHKKGCDIRIFKLKASMRGVFITTFALAKYL